MFSPALVSRQKKKNLRINLKNSSVILVFLQNSTGVSVTSHNQMLTEYLWTIWWKNNMGGAKLTHQIA